MLASWRAKKTESSQESYDKFPSIHNTVQSMRMDYSRILNKPFFIQNISWSNTATAGSTLTSVAFPSAIKTNALVKVPFQSSCLYRMRACFLLQVSGTPMHQGIILAGVLPASISVSDPSQLMAAPHAFLNANESTPVCVEIPFYNRTHLAKTKNTSDSILGFNKEDYAYLYLLVVNPLTPGTSASTTLTISVHTVIKEADFYMPKLTGGTWTAQSGIYDRFLKIPTKIFDGLAYGAKVVTGDFIDALRATVKIYTGFHNPNSPAINSRMIKTAANFLNNVDQPTLIEKLDTNAQFDRIIRDYQYNTQNDEMDLSYILSKPTYLGTTSLSTTTTAGTLLTIIPISPMVELTKNYFYSPMRHIYESSRYWRGTLKLVIQASMTNFHYCKLLVVKDYSCDQRSTTSAPSIDDVHNLSTDTIEFSAGGQIQEIELPYSAESEVLECTKDLVLNGLQHGLVRIYLLQPLVVNGSVSTSVSFNYYMRGGDDLAFFGYPTDSVNITAPTAAFKSKQHSDEIVKVSSDIVDKLRDATSQISSIVETSLNVNEDKIAPPVPAKPRNVKVLSPQCGNSFSRNRRVVNNVILNDIKWRDRYDNDLESKIAKGRVLTTIVRRLTPQSGEVTVDVSDQSDLINEPKVSDDLKIVNADFKQNYSMRDYLRRMVYYGTTTLTVSASNAGIQTFDVNALVGSNTNVGGLFAMYHGFNGGFKFRFVVKNAGLTRAFYLPPGSQYVSTASDVLACKYTPTTAVAMNSTNPTTTVCADQSGAFQHITGASILGATIHEFTIPNMNPHKFFSPYLSTPPSAVNNAGTIIIATSGAIGDVINIDYFMGITDESRLGFQVYAPQAQLQAGTPSTTRYSSYAVGASLLLPPLSTSGYKGLYKF